METQPRDINSWLSAVKDATSELATTTLGLDGCHFQSVSTTLPEKISGSSISLVARDESVQIGIFTNISGCRTIAANMLGMSPSEAETLADADIADAVREVINIVAGGVKRLLCEGEETMQLGLPMFMSGHVEFSTTEQESMVAEAKIGDVALHLMVIRKSK